MTQKILFVLICGTIPEMISAIDQIQVNSKAVRIIMDVDTFKNTLLITFKYNSVRNKNIEL